MDYIFPSLHCTHTFPSTITTNHTAVTIHHHSDCLTTPAPQSLSHIKAAHKTLTQGEVLFCPGYISERSSLYLLSAVCDPGLPDLRSLWTCACDLDPAWYCLRLCFASDIPVLPVDLACLILPPLNKYWCNWIRTPQTSSLHTQCIVTIATNIPQRHKPGFVGPGSHFSAYSVSFLLTDYDFLFTISIYIFVYFYILWYSFLYIFLG